jgi:hypothetical protein
VTPPVSARIRRRGEGRVLFVCKCDRFLYTRRTAEKDFWDWKLNKSTPERKMVFGGSEYNNNNNNKK